VAFALLDALLEEAAGEFKAPMRSSRKACRSLSTAVAEVAPEAPEAAVDVALVAEVAPLAVPLVLPDAVRPTWLNAWKIASMKAVRPLAWLALDEEALLPSLSPSLSVAATVAALDEVEVDVVVVDGVDVDRFEAIPSWTLPLAVALFVPCA
jgi:hypothetical protein